MHTLINAVRGSRGSLGRSLVRALVVLFGALLIGSGLAGTAQAATTLPIEDVHITADKGAVLSLKAGPSLNGNAGVTAAFEDPTKPTPKNMRFVAMPYDGDKTFVVCSRSVSGGGLFDLSCLDVTNKSQAIGATVKIAPFDNTPSQRWVIENKDPLRPQTLTLRNVHSGHYLDVGAAPQSGDKPTLQKFKPDNPSQRWFIKTAKQ
jgi:hypothetical protein